MIEIGAVSNEFIKLKALSRGNVKRVLALARKVGLVPTLVEEEGEEEMEGLIHFLGYGDDEERSSVAESSFFKFSLIVAELEEAADNHELGSRITEGFEILFSECERVVADCQKKLDAVLNRALGAAVQKITTETKILADEPHGKCGVTQPGVPKQHLDADTDARSRS